MVKQVDDEQPERVENGEQVEQVEQVDKKGGIFFGDEQSQEVSMTSLN